MRPKLSNETPQELLRNRLESIIDRSHELCSLAHLIPWQSIADEFGTLYSSNKGRPGIPIRLLAGLTYLGHAYGMSDEEVVNRWIENPYWQFFCGESYFQHQLPVDPSSLSRWRKRIGEKGAQFILKMTVVTGVESEAVKKFSLERISVDTTVQSKAIRYPTDSRLYNRSRERLVKLAHQFNVSLRQSYVRLGPRAQLKAGRYLHARQGKRGRREIRRLKTYLGRVYRDISRKIEGRADIHSVFAPELDLAAKLLVFISSRKRGMTPQMKKELKRRSAIEPIIGHMKSDGKLDRNYLTGELGDKINALLCGAGHNIRIILRKLRERLSFFGIFSMLQKIWRHHSCYPGRIVMMMAG